MEVKKYDLIIIGGGPAGITAGIYAARLNLEALVISKMIGGQIYNKAVAIENWPGIKSIQAPDLARQMEDHLKSLDIKTEIGEVLGVKQKQDIFEVFSKEKTYEARALIITAGAMARSLNVEGEKEFTGRGVSSCSICDGPMFGNKEVAVIGGGNAGFETAFFLTNIAKKIYILEFSEEPKAFGELQNIVKSSGKAEIIVKARLKKIKGDKFVESIIFEKDGEEHKLPVQGVFIEVGYAPASSFIKDLVDLNESGEVIIDQNCQTRTPGIFAAGDICSNSYKQIIIAAGEGAKAALSAYSYIKEKSIEK